MNKMKQVWIPKGARINNYQLATNRLPRYFADPDRFAPERWLPESHPWYDVRYANDNKAVSQPFAAGPRNCIGYRLAVLEFKTLLATLVRGLEFHETTADVQEKISPTLQPVVDGRGGLLPLHVTLAP